MSIFQGRSFLQNDEIVVRGWLWQRQPVRLAAAVAGVMLCVAASAVLAQEAGETDPVISPVEQAAPPLAEPAASESATPVQGEDGAAEAAPETAEPPLLLEETERPDADGEAALGRDPSLPHDLSPWGMFMMADWVVKAVMISLVFASVVTWTVWVAKSMEIAGARARASRALGVVTRSARLEDAAGQLRRRKGPGALLVRAAEEEVRLSADALDHAGSDGLKDRVAMRLSRIQAQAGRRLGRGTGLLATIGATAPFVGLFGTVWGIMNSFIGISEAQTTNLAVVAPGIAEALLATALGLVAAIPAVVFYNMFARAITGYRQMLADAASGVELLVSRDLDYRLVPAMEQAAADDASALTIAATRS